MSCSARLSVYALFAAAFFGKDAGNVVFLIYLVGVFVALVYGLVLRHSLFHGNSSPFVAALGTVFRELGKFYGTLLAVMQTALGWSMAVLDCCQWTYFTYDFCEPKTYRQRQIWTER